MRVHESQASILTSAGLLAAAKTGVTTSRLRAQQLRNERADRALVDVQSMHASHRLPFSSLQARLIITYSHSGRTASLVAKYRPSMVCTHSFTGSPC